MTARMPTTPSSTMPSPAGVNGIAVSSDADRATKKAPLMPRWTSREVSASRLTPRQNDHRQADADDHLDLGRQVAPEAPESGRQAQDGYREQIEDALDEDRAEGAAQRNREGRLEQPAAIDA